jgi:hypothetical protein
LQKITIEDELICSLLLLTATELEEAIELEEISSTEDDELICSLEEDNTDEEDKPGEDTEDEETSSFVSIDEDDTLPSVSKAMSLSGSAQDAIVRIRIPRIDKIFRIESFIVHLL